VPEPDTISFSIMVIKLTNRRWDRVRHFPSLLWITVLRITSLLLYKVGEMKKALAIVPGLASFFLSFWVMDLKTVGLKGMSLLYSIRGYPVH